MVENPESETPADERADAAPEEALAQESPEAAEPQAQAAAPAEAEPQGEAEPEREADRELAAPAEAEAQPPDQAPPPAPSEPQQPSSPKERRRLSRSRHTEARPQRSPEERHAERLAVRREQAARRRERRVKERAKAKARRGTAAAPVSEAAVAPVHDAAEGARKVRQGVVISNKAAKTIVVRIDIARRHRRYEKIVRSSNTLHAHDENDDAREGDVVRVIESRPLSRTKRWRLVEVLERAQ
jgi:small subunit ribosomal protein S17